MMDSANNLNLGLELSVSLPTPGLEALDGDLFAVGQHTLVNVPEPALTQEVGLREAGGGGDELIVGESVLVEAHRGRKRRRRQRWTVGTREVRAHVAAAQVGWRRRRWHWPTSTTGITGTHSAHPHNMVAGFWSALPIVVESCW